MKVGEKSSIIQLQTTAAKGSEKEMLQGTYRHAMDAKGRLFMPSKLRSDLGEGFIITRGLGTQLFVFSQADWKEFTDKLRALPMSDPGAQAFVRLFLSGAYECEVDKQGRFLIPQELRAYARIEKDTVITGLISRVEIWSEENWDRYTAQYNDEASERFAEMLRSAQQFGI